MPPIDSKNHPTLFLPVMFALLCVANDFLMMPMVAVVADGPPSFPFFHLLLAIVGCVLAQGNLLAAWLVWSDQPFWKRFTRHWTVAAVLYLVWVAGFALSRPSLEPTFAELSSVVGLSVPLVSMAAQIPLWIVRQIFGWRLIRGDIEDNPPPAPLSIRHLITATVLVAISLALARSVPIPEDEEQLIIWMVMSIAAIVVTTLAMLPAARLLRIQPFQRGAVFAGLYAAIWVSLVWLIVAVVRVYGLFLLPPVILFEGLTSVILSFAATVILGATAAHLLGYRLVTGRPRRLQ